MPMDGAKLARISRALETANWDALKAERAPFSPPDGDKSVATPTRTKNGAFVAYSKTRITGVVDRLAFVKLIESDLKKGSVTFEMKRATELPTAAARRGYLAVWWLPWDDRGAIVELSIPSLAQSPTITPPGGEPIPNPAVFFTAALSGCSVFVKGHSTSPTVSHAGRGNSISDDLGKVQFDRLGGTSEDVWRNIFKGVTYHDEGPLPKTAHGAQWAPMSPSRGPVAPFGEINMTNYVTGKYAEIAEDGTATAKRMAKGDTFLAQHLEQFLKNKHMTTLTGMMVSPYGSVFGLRKGQNWEFYLQRNATIMYRHARKEKSILGVRYGKLVPVGNQMTESFCFGEQQFFPGTGVFMQNAYDTITLS